MEEEGEEGLGVKGGCMLKEEGPGACCRGACAGREARDQRAHHLSLAHAMMQASWAKRIVPLHALKPSISACRGKAACRQMRHSGTGGSAAFTAEIGADEEFIG